MDESKFDLKKRTRKFGLDVIACCQKIPRNPITSPLITQLVKAGTSVGANYCEADDAESKADFKHKIGIVKKEASESLYFLHIIVAAYPQIKDEAVILQNEAKEIHLIFSSIFNKMH